MPFSSVFIDLTKAFDTINRKAQWTVLERNGCLRIFVKILHDGMIGEVLTGGDATGSFKSVME